METKTKLGQTPYFGNIGQTSSFEDTGMTIRQKIAAGVLCALLSNPNSAGIPKERLIMDAIEYTDTFLKLESE